MSSTKFVADENRKTFSAALKNIYHKLCEGVDSNSGIVLVCWYN